MAEGKGKRADEVKAEKADGEAARKRAEAEEAAAAGEAEKADQAFAEAAEAESEAGDERGELADLAADLDDLAADSRWGHQLDPVKFQLAKAAESVRQAVRIITQFSVEAGDPEDDRPKASNFNPETGEVEVTPVESKSAQDVSRFESDRDE